MNRLGSGWAAKGQTAKTDINIFTQKGPFNIKSNLYIVCMQGEQVVMDVVQENLHVSRGPS